MPITSVRGYSDTLTARLGVEYALPKYNTAVRVGYIYDPTPVPAAHLTAELPDIDRHDICAGMSYHIAGYDLHLGLLWVIPRHRSTAMDPNGPPEYKGTFDVTAFVASVGVSGKIM
jgi:long-subunit fatty acid transport protein